MQRCRCSNSSPAIKRGDEVRLLGLGRPGHIGGMESGAREPGERGERCRWRWVRGRDVGLGGGGGGRAESEDVTALKADG